MKTPGPYLREGCSIFSLEGQINKDRPYLQSRVFIEIKGALDTPQEEVEATAEYFQRAANCHDELVVALEAIKDAATTLDNPHLVLAFIENVAEEALALAKQEAP